MMLSYVWHCLHLLHEKIQVLIISLQHDHVHVTQRLVRRNSVGSMTKSIRLR